MKCSSLTLGVLAVIVAEVLAFPAGMVEELSRQGKRCPYADLQDSPNMSKDKRQVNAALGFNAAAQRISTTGDNAFIAPNFAAGDIRGPCPGLNALANHGYLSRNGIITLTEGITATNQIFGMGLDLATFLSTYATVTDGNPLTLQWSIGGAPPVVLGTSLGGLLGRPQGISQSHNKYESDSSPTRYDYYANNGDAYSLNLKYFKELYALQATAEEPNYNLDVLIEHRMTRFQESVSTNPYFFYGPFSGLAVSQAAFSFIYRFMSNKSEEAPEGTLNKEVLKSFFSITGDDNNLKWVPGHERIPDNWYRRAIGDEYTIPYFQTDILYIASKYPEILSIGGNTGTVNSFTGVDISDLTGGVFNLETLTEGNNLACLVFQTAALGEPDILKGVLSDVTSAVSKITDVVGDIASALSCPKLSNIDASKFKQFPGYTKSPYF